MAEQKGCYKHVINEHETIHLYIYQNFILHEIHIRNECCFEEHP